MEDGVDIELHFKPGDPVDATMIGMVQKVTSKMNGALLAVSPTVAARSLPAGKPGAGAHIDRLSEYRNPLYPTVDPGGAKDKLWTAKTDPGWGSTVTTTWTRPACCTIWMPFSRTRLSWQATALIPVRSSKRPPWRSRACRPGAFYGSVQWGWKSDAAGAFTRLPLTKVSGDVPSGTFAAAQALWNKSKDSSGRDLLKFYTASGKYVSTPDAPLVGNPQDAAGTEIAKLPQNARLEVINRGLFEAFNKDAADKWWKVTVVEGAAIGKTGWVKSSQLSGKKT